MSANWFIALPVPAGPWFEALQPPDGVRLFGASDLHLTVAFLGAASEAQAQAAFEHAPSFPLPALQVRLGPVECLGSKRRPSAFSALLLDGRAEVEAAMGAVRKQMWDAAQARHDERPPLAHVTLARPSRRATTEDVKQAAHWAKTLDLGAPSVCIDSIALYTWSEDRKHTLFRTVSILPLTAAAGAT
jgi:2'-5' RNA ligase